MKSFILLIPAVIIFSGISCAQEVQKEENLIYWSDDYKLVWTDFDMLPLRYSEYGACSVVGFESELKINDKYIKAIIRTYFDKDESWAKNWIPILLVHEQGHFDLAELHARKLRMRVKEMMKSEYISGDKFQKMNKEAIETLMEAHEEYDQGTNRSQDYKAQIKWMEHIKEQLQEMQNFSNPEIIVSREAN